ncbi:hypothetical protein RF11_12799 [Thelohanellus kitauei]|uniref:Uncharacterized protein n=1 Tax=Thelohanellus kitauei TaxID=669202 RepID=A0A0C2M2S0_THEKT|nr:hypothetical protein RF11_12799 [Thelohanellus kitauei]
MLVSNFVYDFNSLRTLTSKCEDDKYIYSFVEFNSLSEQRRVNFNEIGSNETLYLFYQVIWDTNEISDAYDVSVSLFETTNTLRIFVELQCGKQKIVLAKRSYENLIITYPNTERVIFVDYNQIDNYLRDASEPATFGIYFSYRCQGYTGFNCKYDCDNRTGKFECDFDTGIKYCKDPNKTAPPDCNSSEFDDCNITDDICQSQGNCMVPEKCTCNSTGLTFNNCPVTVCILKSDSCIHGDNNNLTYPRCRKFKTEVFCICGTRNESENTVKD